MLQRTGTLLLWFIVGALAAPYSSADLDRDGYPDIAEAQFTTLS